jgi:cellulose synthase (UDP-forming)
MEDSKPVRFSVALGQIPSGNAILFSSDRSALPAPLMLPAGSGPLLALRSNPGDPYGSILVIAGDDEDQLLAVARTLSLTRSATPATPARGLPLSGDTQQIPDLVLPTPRVQDDAPRWLQAGKVNALASCQVKDTLQTDGSSPVPVYFHVPPDLYYGEKENLKLRVNYRYDARPIAAGSALRVFVNGNLVSEAPLLPGAGFQDRQRLILLPVSDIRPFGNTILFRFDFIPVDREAQNTGAVVLSGEVLCNSTLDLQGLSLWKQMPNLEIFANAGFPFTRDADLSETTVVLPAEPTAAEIALYLHLMGHFGAQTGYPALRVSVAGPSTVISPARDYLILGTVADQPAFNSLDPLLPVTMDSNGVHSTPLRGYATLVSSIKGATLPWWSRLFGGLAAERLPSNDGGIPDALVEEIGSPSSPDRSIVVIVLKQDASADPFAEVLLDRSQSGDIAGSASLLRNGRFDSYAIDGGAYYVGTISWYAVMRIWLTQYSLPLLFVVTVLSFLLATWARGWLARQASERLRLAKALEVVDISEDSDGPL